MKIQATLACSLTGKFVRTFRKKERNGQLCWYRWSRLVAREYNYLSIREDTFNSVVTRLIPAMVMSGLYSEDHVIGALDISDAYLQVPQESKRHLKVVDAVGYDDLIIAKCLPGQRDGARCWYFFFCEFLEKQLGMECCKEQPSILKVSKAHGSGCSLLHVDYVLFTMSSDFAHQTFLPILKQAFKLSVTWVDRKKGGSFEFLKRLHVLDAGFEKLDIYGETKHVKQCVEMFKKANGGVPAKMYNTPAASHVFAGRDDSEGLNEEISGAYRSLVGCILFLSHERSDVQHTVKCLASYLSSPTRHAWIQLGRLIGYLQRTVGYGVQMQCTQPGTSLFEKLSDSDKCNCSCPCLVEPFSDSDWQGGKDLCSTSSAAHSNYINGNLIHSSSRTQHVVSLSCTEAEYFAMTSGCIDTIYIEHILEFLMSCEVEAQVKVDNSATRQIANKLGISKLRHVQGKLLWVQSQVKNGVLT